MARSRKQQSIKRDDVARPPPGVPWCWLDRDLARSPAWKRRSIHCVRLIDFLMLEHLANAGLENGNLAAPWDQLVRHGMSRRYIKAAIEEAVALRLVAVDRGGLRADRKAAMSRYRLTFYATRIKNDEGVEYWIAAGDEWRKVNDEAARKVLAERPAWNAPKKLPGAHSGNSSSPTVEPDTR